MSLVFSYISKKKRKKKKKGDSTWIGSPSLKGSYHAVLPGGDLYEGEGDSTPEPLSESELDDGTTESIISSIGPLHDSKPSEVSGTRTTEIIL